MLVAMRWENASHDEIERGFSHFLGLSSASLAEVCDLIVAADTAQLFLADGSPDMVQWLSARYGLSHSTARRLVDVARRLADLPELRARFAAGELSFDQTEAISKMATADTEGGLIEEARGLSPAALDRAARRANPPAVSDERSVWERRSVHIQRSLDGFQGRMTAELPGAEMDIVETAIRASADQTPPNPETGMFDPYPARLADGLVEVCATTGDQSSPPPQLTVHADWGVLTGGHGVTESETGSLLAAETARRLACDAVVETAVYH